METSKKGRKRGKKRKRAKKKADNKSYREHKSDDEAQEQEAVARLAPEEHEQRQEQEQTVYTVRRAEEGGVPESETNHMIDAALYVGTNRSITQRVHHLTQLHIQLHERLFHMDEKIIFLIGKNRVQFSCADSMVSVGGVCFPYSSLF
jgi:hypothetical protein